MNRILTLTLLVSGGLGAFTSHALKPTQKAGKMSQRKPAGACENVDMFDTEKVLQLIKKAKNCTEAFQIAEDCAIGASGDAPRASLVIEKCEKEFAKHPAAETKTYKNALAICDRQLKDYTREQGGGTVGSMWTATHAFCRMGVAHFFKDLFEPYENSEDTGNE